MVLTTGASPVRRTTAEMLYGKPLSVLEKMKTCSRCDEEKPLLNERGVCLDCSQGPMTFFG